MAEDAGALDILVPYIDPAVRRVLLDLPDEKLTEEAVRDTYKTMVTMQAGFYASIYLGFTPSDEQVEELTEFLINRYLHEMPVNKPSGFAYKHKECVPWVDEAKDDIKWRYWDRYRDYLLTRKGWERRVVKGMADDTLKILDMMVDPRPRSFPEGADRRGLVVADVQSGKTSNYIGLMCRAADAGYHVIIVLAGIYNVLRAQTQVRIEEGFTGLNSLDNSVVGCGEINKMNDWHYGSTRLMDFGKNTMQALMGTGAKGDSWIFVVKKNKAILESLNQWLVAHPEVDGPLLLIDDEADNASINVKYAKDDVSVINGLVRRLLRHFKKSSYVGYTATPFANILIDPNAESDEEGEDIFPRSFIYTLEPSTTYFGSEKVFAGVDVEGERPACIRYIEGEDVEKILPSKHKKDIAVVQLPLALRKAVRTFVLASTLRAIRGDGGAHTTMMVNVSPYIAVQGQVANLLEDYVEEMRAEVRVFGGLSSEARTTHIRELHETWSEEFPREQVDWEEVKRELYDVMRKIHVVVVNSASKTGLNYEAPHVEHAIAVGGYRLSRGLTLEGLLVSYYSRNARAYDTLMQMARWYGYRPGYEDLCRVWMTRDAVHWYSFVADATLELVGQLRSMLQLNSDPSMYGLMVRKSPSSLIITSRDKMGVGQYEKKPLNLNDSFIETTALYRDRECFEHNRACARTLFEAIAASGCERMPDTGNSVGFRHVEPELVKEFIDSYRAPESIVGQPQHEYVLASIDKLEAYLNADEGWDVVAVNGTEVSDTETIDGCVIRYEGRFPGKGTNRDVARVGNKMRLSGRDVEAYGLPKEVREAVEEEYRTNTGSANTPGYVYRAQRKRPLLVVHFVKLRFKLDENGRSATYDSLVGAGDISGWDSAAHTETAIGWSISYPKIDDPNLLEFDYLLNGPALANLYGTDTMDDDLDEDAPDAL